MQQGSNFSLLERPGKHAAITVCLMITWEICVALAHHKQALTAGVITCCCLTALQGYETD
jgi:hypothetical protein